MRHQASAKKAVVDSLSVRRRLSCIVAADAVGYSGLMAKDEEATLRVLAAHRAVIDGIIKFHEGRIVNTAGDSVLAEFTSVVEAVRCAVEIQEAIKTRNDSLASDHRMQFRVGINLGDVVVKDKDLFGDGVNVAARLETIAEPGGICISSSVYDQITGKLDLRFQDIGDQALKNIGRPIHVYRIAPGVPLGISAATPNQFPARTRWKVGAAGLAGAALVSAAVAWQAGWLRPAPVDPDRGKDPLVPISASPAATQAKDGAAPSAPSTHSTASPADNAAARAPKDKDATTTSGSTVVQRRPTEQQAPPVSIVTRNRQSSDALKRQIESEIARMRGDALSGRGATSLSGAPAMHRSTQSGSDVQSYQNEPGVGAPTQGIPYRQRR